MLSKSFKPAKCKTSLKLAVARIKLLRNKREVQVKQMRRELAQLLESGQEQTARIRVAYMGMVGSFPFNSFLSGVLSCVGTAVLAVCLRIQVNKENKEFKDLPPERAFADFVLCNLVLHLVIMNFLG